MGLPALQSGPPDTNEFSTWRSVRRLPSSAVGPGMRAASELFHRQTTSSERRRVGGRLDRTAPEPAASKIRTLQKVLEDGTGRQATARAPVDGGSQERGECRECRERKARSQRSGHSSLHTAGRSRQVSTDPQPAGVGCHAGAKRWTGVEEEGVEMVRKPSVAKAK